MNKKLKYSLIGVIGFLVVSFIVLTFSMDYLVKTGIEQVGSEMTQTAVTVESVSVSPLSGNGTIKGLKVDNPEGFESEHAFVLRTMNLKMNLWSYFSDTLKIDEIIISEPAISVIQKLPQNNLLILLNNMEESMQGESSSMAMIIDLLRMEQGTVSVTPSIGGEKGATVKMGTLEITGMGRSGSSSTRQVVKSVADRVVSQAIKVVLSGELDKLQDKAKDAVKDLFN